MPVGGVRNSTVQRRNNSSISTTELSLIRYGLTVLLPLWVVDLIVQAGACFCSGSMCQHDVSACRQLLCPVMAACTHGSFVPCLCLTQCTQTHSAWGQGSWHAQCVASHDVCSSIMKLVPPANMSHRGCLTPGVQVSCCIGDVLLKLVLLHALKVSQPGIHLGLCTCAVLPQAAPGSPPDVWRQLLAALEASAQQQ